MNGNRDDWWWIPAWLAGLIVGGCLLYYVPRRSVLRRASTSSSCTRNSRRSDPIPPLAGRAAGGIHRPPLLCPDAAWRSLMPENETLIRDDVREEARRLAAACVEPGLGRAAHRRARDMASLSERPHRTVRAVVSGHGLRGEPRRARSSRRCWRPRATCLISSSTACTVRPASTTRSRQAGGPSTSSSTSW